MLLSNYRMLLGTRLWEAYDLTMLDEVNGLRYNENGSFFCSAITFHINWDRANEIDLMAEASVTAFNKEWVELFCRTGAGYVYRGKLPWGSPYVLNTLPREQYVLAFKLTEVERVGVNEKDWFRLQAKLARMKLKNESIFGG